MSPKKTTNHQEKNNESSENPIVLCVATSGYSSLWRFCIESQIDYCQKHNYEHILKTKPAAGLNSKWSKIQYAAELVNQNRDVMIIDADIEISKNAPPFIEEIYKYNEKIFAVKGISGRLNSGVIILKKNSPITFNFIKDCLNTRLTPVKPEDFVTEEGENGHLIALSKDAKYRNEIIYLDSRWNSSRPEMFEDAYFRHYTNFLKNSLNNGEIGVEIPIFETNENKFHNLRRSNYLFHQISRDNALKELSSDENLMKLFKKTVLSAEDDMKFPRMTINDANAWIWRYEYLNYMLEMPTLEFIRNNIKPGGWFLDGGAHMGYYSKYIHHFSSGNQNLVAIEAHPENFSTLCGNIGNINAHLLHAALSENDGIAELYDGTGHSNSSLIEGSPSNGKKYTVKTRSIDSLCDEFSIDGFDLIKIDIEGSELQALRGASQMLLNYSSIIILEINPKLLQLSSINHIDILNFMETYGYLGRLIFDNFKLGPLGYIATEKTRNAIFAKIDHWNNIL